MSDQIIPRPDFRCSADINIGGTIVNTLLDTGASGGNCIEASLVKILPPAKVRILHKNPSVCIGINKIPIRSVGEASILFSIGSPTRVFRARFLIIENLTCNYEYVHIDFLSIQYFLSNF